MIGVFDVIRPDAFMKDGPLRSFDVLATSTFCAADVVSASDNDKNVRCSAYLSPDNLRLVVVLINTNAEQFESE